MPLGRVLKDKIDDEQQAREAALRYLSAREHSRRELFTKLRRRFSAKAAQSAVDSLTENDLQSDSRCAETLLRQLTAKGYGPMLIRQKFFARGLDPSRLEALETPDWTETALECLRKKCVSLPDTREDRQKLIQFLCRRGFAPGQAIEAVRRLCADV